VNGIINATPREMVRPGIAPKTIPYIIPKNIATQIAGVLNTTSIPAIIGSKISS
jgi:hypothetical protein